MTGWLLLFLTSFLPLFAISIDVTQDKQALYIDETLTVTYTLQSTDSASPNLFPLLYDLNAAPLIDFRLVSSSVKQPKAAVTVLTFTLAPLTTGDLIFAPGVVKFGNVPYLLPAIKAEGLGTGFSALPIARLLPLYPERRIELSPEMRLKLMSQEVLQKALNDLVATYDTHRRAVTFVLILLIGLPCTLLFLWGLIYFELLQESLRPIPEKPSELQILIGEAKELNSNKLSLLVKEALGAIVGENYHSLDLAEVRPKIAESQRFVTTERDELLALLDKLVQNNYADKKMNQEEWQTAHSFVVSLLQKHLFNKSHQN